MSTICWGVDDAQEELKRATKDEEKIVLNVVEVPHSSGRYFYELRMQPDVATIILGSAFKNYTLFDSFSKCPEEVSLRRRISNVLDTPHPCYQRRGEKVISALGIGHFHIPIDEKHLSPRDEMNLVKATLSCAQVIGFNRIPYIGRTEVNQNKMRQALEEITKRQLSGSYR
jgi:hypothetical protein